MSKKITLPVFGEKLTKLSENPHVVVCGGVGGKEVLICVENISFA